MIIKFVLLLAALALKVYVSVTITPNNLMREVLERVMTCPKDFKEDIQSKPVAALSPARYIQLVAIARKNSNASSCGERISSDFQINDPRTWSFCSMGVCINEVCSCFENFGGDKCNKFYGRCWLFYCFLTGCESEVQELKCRCHQDLYGELVTSGIYFYDHGIGENYKPPKADLLTTPVEGPSIQQKVYKKFKVQRYFHPTITTRFSTKKYRRHTSYSERQNDLYNEDSNGFRSKKNYQRNRDYPATRRQNRDSKFLNVFDSLESESLMPKETIEVKENDIDFSNHPSHRYIEDEKAIYPHRKDTPSLQNHYNQRNTYSNTRNRMVSENSYDPYFQYKKRNDYQRSPYQHMANSFKKPMREAEYWRRSDVPYGSRDVPEYSDQFLGRNTVNKVYETTQKESQEFSTVKLLWSDTEEGEEDEYKFVSGIGFTYFHYNRILIFLEILILILYF